jgi:hypothetical protein
MAAPKNILVRDGAPNSHTAACDCDRYPLHFDGLSFMSYKMYTTVTEGIHTHACFAVVLFWLPPLSPMLYLLVFLPSLWQVRHVYERCLEPNKKTAKTAWTSSNKIFFTPSIKFVIEFLLNQITSNGEPLKNVTAQYTFRCPNMIVRLCF